jgi:hypothetical protein
MALICWSVPARAALVGHWTFEEGEERVDRTGNFPDLLLMGDVLVVDGALDVNGEGTTATGWAVSDSVNGAYRGPVLTNKTLVAWVRLQSLGDWANSGSAITLDRVGGDQFDGIVFGERENNRWVNGSSNWGRTQDLNPGFEETEVDAVVMLAFAYEHLEGGQLRVSAYRNGELLGGYETGSASRWETGDAEVLFGVRHGSTAGGPGALDALILEARIYDTALSAAEAAGLYQAGPTVIVDSDNDGLRDDWEVEHFGGLGQTAAGDPDGDGLSNLGELQRRTDPRNGDTDGDGLSDLVETGTGVYVGVNDTGTLATQADTDGDVLSDGVETNTGVFVSASNTGTHPLKANTDGDRLSDGEEVVGGTNPVDFRDPVKSLSDLMVGHWTFSPGRELVDSAGNFPDLLLKGDARVMEGRLDVGGSGTTASGWAVTDSGAGGYRGPVITNKTLVAWVVMQGLDSVAKSGAAIAPDRVNGDQFDGIVFAERQANRWVNGSSGWQRTQDFSPGAEQTGTGVLTQLVITYEHLGADRMRITGYRDGVVIGQYETGSPSRWEALDAEVFFGVRHGDLNNGAGALDAWIEEAAIYRVALTASQVRALHNLGPETEAPLLGHWTFETGEELADRTGNFSDLLLKGNATVSRGSLEVNGSGTTASGWAVTDSDRGGYVGAAIEAKTLVAWVQLDGLSDVARAGSAISLDRVGGDQFDGIVFAEREDNRWMNGSSGWQRTLNFDPGFEETDTGALVQLAITYEVVEGSLRITGYRNGEVIGVTEGFVPVVWESGDAEVLFGVRHGTTVSGTGALEARIEEARLYGGALSEAAIREMHARGPIVSEDRDGDGLADSWELTYFGDLDEGPADDPDGDLSSNAQEFLRGTLPMNPDTDGDGVGDGAETKTGRFVSASDTGTDPLVADTDGDGLKDGAENPLLPYDPARPQEQAGTDPNMTDTDEDGIPDGAEVLAGTNPTDPGDPVRPPVAGYLIGHWTFEAGEELVDLTGNFPPLLLMGDAQVVDGRLDLTGFGTSASGWAITDSDNGAYAGPGITNKTLMVWATMRGLGDVAFAGSLLTLDRVVSDQFDGIVFGERQNNRWMNGSSFWNRTADLSPGFEETEAGIAVHLAISYETLATGGMRVTAYRNRERLGQYESGTPSSWVSGDAEVMFGIRHGNTAEGGGGAVDALIDEARVYGQALNAVEIRRILSPPVEGPALTLRRAGSRVRLEWSDAAARLEEALTVRGPWNPVANAASPYEADAVGSGARFYRLAK